ncbi:MAG: porin [Fuerstiella sp.]|nr:porin [Fuerstiella sp.]
MLNQSWKTVLASAVIIGGCCFSAPSYAGGLFSGSGNLLTDQLAKMSCCGESACGDESSCSLAECGEGCCATGAGGITFGGWTQVGYHNGGDGVFNDESGSINLHQGWLYAERVADGRNGLDFGFRADVMYGIDADETDSSGNNPGNWDYRNGFDHGPYGFALPQLYVEMASGDLSVKAGHFFTIMSYERVTSPDNFFYSRSRSLDWIEPQTHTGALATYAVSCDTNVYAGWTLGWDTGFDQRDGGSNFLGGFSTAVTDNATFTYVTSAGNHGRDGEGYAHMLLLDVAVTCKLNYVIQSDFEDVVEDGETDNDVAITQYLFYDVNDTFSVGGRFEWIEERDSDGDWGSQFQTTLGVNVRPTDNIVIRPEVRIQPDTDNNNGHEKTVFGVDAILVF